MVLMVLKPAPSLGKDMCTEIQRVQVTPRYDQETSYPRNILIRLSKERIPNTTKGSHPVSGKGAATEKSMPHVPKESFQARRKWDKTVQKWERCGQQGILHPAKQSFRNTEKQDLPVVSRKQRHPSSQTGFLGNALGSLPSEA